MQFDPLFYLFCDLTIDLQRLPYGVLYPVWMKEMDLPVVFFGDTMLYRLKMIPCHAEDDVGVFDHKGFKMV